MRFPSVLVSSILLAPLAYGSPLQPGPYGSVPTDKSFRLTFDASPGTHSTYVVDSKSNFWPTTSNEPIGFFTANEGTSDKESSRLHSFAANAFNSRGVSGSIGMTLWGGPELSGFKGLGVVPDLITGNKNIFWETNGLALGSEGRRDGGGATPVSATPLPGSWTMMLIGLCGFGYVAHRLRKKGNALAAA